MYEQAKAPPSHFEQGVRQVRVERKYKQLAFAGMQKLHGWCSEQKAETLIDLVWFTRPKVIVEIGVFGGKSLVPMAFALKGLGGGMAYGVDPWLAEASVAGMEGANKEWWGTLDHQSILEDLQDKIALFELQDYIQLIRATSVDAPDIQNIDLLHIDGNHSEEASVTDVKKWLPLVRPGGLIIFDDITWGTTSKATDLLDAQCARIRTVEDVENAWAIWIKL